MFNEQQNNPEFVNLINKEINDTSFLLHSLTEHGNNPASIDALISKLKHLQNVIYYWNKAQE